MFGLELLWLRMKGAGGTLAREWQRVRVLAQLA